MSYDTPSKGGLSLAKSHAAWENDGRTFGRRWSPSEVEGGLISSTSNTSGLLALARPLGPLTRDNGVTHLPRMVCTTEQRRCIWIKHGPNFFQRRNKYIWYSVNQEGMRTATESPHCPSIENLLYLKSPIKINFDQYWWLFRSTIQLRSILI